MQGLNYGVQVAIAVGSMSLGGWTIGVVVELIRRKVHRANAISSMASGTNRVVDHDRRAQRRDPGIVRR